MFAVIDNDNSGKISFKEYCIFAKAKRQVDFKDPNWFERMIFRMIDADGSGEIYEDEFKRLLELLGVPTTDENVKQLLAALDTDGNGVIDMDEFITFFSQIQ